MKGILYILISSLCYAILNSIIKFLGTDIPPFELLFYRNLFSTLTLFPLVLFYLKDLKKLTNKKSLLINSMRGSLGFVGICFWFISMKFVPITECVALSFTTPLFITAMAIVSFQEKVTKLRWVALLVGLSGAVIITSPNFNGINSYSVLTLMAAFFWALSAMVVKSFTNHCHPIAIIFFTSCINLLLSTPVAFNLSHDMSLKTVGLLTMCAITSNAAQIFMAFSYKKAPISVVIPFDFMRLVFTIPIAFILFNETIKSSTMIGALIIVCSSSFLAFIAKKNQKKS